MRFFITGSAGFVGYHLARRLLEAGHEVTGYDAMTSYYDVALKEYRNDQLAVWPRFTFIKGHLENLAELSSVLSACSPHIVVHLAAQAGVRASLTQPDLYLQSNIIGSYHLFEACKGLKDLKHLLVASSSSVYGDNSGIPSRESDKTDEPLSFYAATKKSMEVIAHSYAHLHGLPITVFRFFTVYGPAGRPDMALLKFAEMIKRGESIPVYGHGKMRRDFTYIDDLVKSVIALSAIIPNETNRSSNKQIETLSYNAPFRIVNIGGGHPVDLMTFIRHLEQALGTTAKLHYLPMQAGEVPVTYADSALLKELIGWVPNTSIGEGIARTVEWHKSLCRRSDLGRKDELQTLL